MTWNDVVQFFCQGMTQEQCARELRVTPSAISRWLSGKRTPTREMRAEIARRMVEATIGGEG